MVRACSIALALFVVASVSRGGDLSPPAGIVAPTMKTLDQVEARVSVNSLGGSADAARVITAPGNYYLTENIVVPAGQSGIEVALGADPSNDPGDNPVIIDLNGFSILGGAGSFDGVRYTTTFVNGRFVLRSGVPGSVISGMGGHGVHLDGVPVAKLMDFGVSRVGGDGVRAVVPRSVLKTYFETGDVPTQQVSGDGVHVEGYVECNCTHLISGGNGGDGGEFVNCDRTLVDKAYVDDCVGSGIVISAATGGTVRLGGGNNDNWDFGGGGSGGRIVVRSCAGGGIIVADASNARIRGADVQSTGGYGIDVTCDPAVRAEVRVEKFHVKQEFGPQQGGARVSGGGAIYIFGGRIADCGANGLECSGYTRGQFGSLNIGSSGLDGVSLAPGGGGGGGVVEDSSTQMDDVGVFGSVGDNVRFNPLATGGTHDIAVSGGHFNGAGGHGLSVVPQQAGTYVFDLVVTDNVSLSNGVHGVYIALQNGMQINSRMSGSATNKNGGDGVHVVASGASVGASTMSMTDCTSNQNSVDGTHVQWSQTGGPFVFTTQSGEMVGNGGRGAYRFWVKQKMGGANVSGNGGHGLEAVGGTLDARDCSFSGNGGDGVNTEELPPWIWGCAANGNTGNGLDVNNCIGATVRACGASNNSGIGIMCRSACLNGSVVENMCDNNSTAGVQVDGTGMFVARCSATFGAAGGITVAQGNLVGPSVDNVNIATEGSPNSNMVR